VGLVEQMILDKDLNGVSVEVRIDVEAKNLLRSDTQFRVVRPKIGKGGVSGLGTLLSGAYTELAAGNAKEVSTEFIGLDTRPVTPIGTPSIHITLDSEGDRAIQVGDPILFHGFKVGRIEFVFFNNDERIVYYNAFIESPYGKLVTTNTKFWQINGFELEMSADGIRAQTGTLETMISGGVSFDVPDDLPRGNVIEERVLYGLQKEIGNI
jgi:paraquat-inducible protein B